MSLPHSSAQNGPSKLETDAAAKKLKGPATSSSSCSSSTRSYKIPVIVLCAVLGYGICQLDLSFQSTRSMPVIRSFTTSNYMNNGNGDGKKPILQISVVGERNSGTRWTWGYVPFFVVWQQPQPQQPCIIKLTCASIFGILVCGHQQSLDRVLQSLD